MIIGIGVLWINDYTHDNNPGGSIREALCTILWGGYVQIRRCAQTVTYTVGGAQITNTKTPQMIS